MAAFGLGSKEALDLDVPSVNHFKTASVSTNLLQEIKARNLRRVAGNAFVCQSTKDFWAIKGNKLVRLTVEEVDNGETLNAAPADQPQSFLEQIMGELEF